MRKRIGLTVCSLVFAAVVAAGSSTAYAGVLADFIPQPASPGIPEFTWDGSALHNAAGASGTGVLNSPTGLQVTTPLVVPGIPGSDPSQSTFYDCSLWILVGGDPSQGIPAGGPATVVTVVPGLMFVVAQPLAAAEFQVWSHDPGTGSVLLLAGDFEDAVIAGLLGSSTGTTLSATVTYTGGAILTYSGLSHPITGEFSWSLLDIVPPLAIGQNGFLVPFDANATGQFSGVPEPATLAMLALGGLALLARRWRK